MNLETFKKKVEDYLSNNMTAMLGQIQLTSNERAELKVDLATLGEADQKAAETFLKSKGIERL